MNRLYVHYAQIANFASVGWIVVMAGLILLFNHLRVNCTSFYVESFAVIKALQFNREKLADRPPISRLVLQGQVPFV